MLGVLDPKPKTLNPKLGDFEAILRATAGGAGRQDVPLCLGLEIKGSGVELRVRCGCTWVLQGFYRVSVTFRV